MPLLRFPPCLVTERNPQLIRTIAKDSEACCIPHVLVVIPIARIGYRIGVETSGWEGKWESYPALILLVSTLSSNRRTAIG